ncbi:hypothetical protein BASA83_010935 [Batrachochytrium salamandrivorans]|nr:hypothetical protein BASA83_010935 [Batrachochytrium salamandrivorans]
MKRSACGTACEWCANRGGGARAVATSGPAKGFSYALNWKPKRGARGASNNPSRGRIGKKVAHIPRTSWHNTYRKWVRSVGVTVVRRIGVTGSDAEDSDQNDMNSDDDSEEDAQPTKRAKLARRPIKPKGKKGKIFADQSQMMDLIDSLNVKEEETIGRKLAKRIQIKKDLVEKEKTSARTAKMPQQPLQRWLKKLPSWPARRRPPKKFGLATL